MTPRTDILGRLVAVTVFVGCLSILGPLLSHRAGADGGAISGTDPDSFGTASNLYYTTNQANALLNGKVGTNVFVTATNALQSQISALGSADTNSAYLPSNNVFRAGTTNYFDVVAATRGVFGTNGVNLAYDLAYYGLICRTPQSQGGFLIDDQANTLGVINCDLGNGLGGAPYLSLRKAANGAHTLVAGGSTPTFSIIVPGNITLNPGGANLLVANSVNVSINSNLIACTSGGILKTQNPNDTNEFWGSLVVTNNLEVGRILIQTLGIGGTNWISSPTMANRIMVTNAAIIAAGPGVTAATLAVAEAGSISSMQPNAANQIYQHNVQQGLVSWLAKSTASGNYATTNDNAKALEHQHDVWINGPGKLTIGQLGSAIARHVSTNFTETLPSINAGASQTTNVLVANAVAGMEVTVGITPWQSGLLPFGVCTNNGQIVVGLANLNLITAIQASNTTFKVSGWN